MPAQLQIMPGDLLQESPRVMQSWLPSEVSTSTSSIMCSRSLSCPRCAAWEARPRAETGIYRRIHPTLGVEVPAALQDTGVIMSLRPRPYAALSCELCSMHCHLSCA